MKQIEEQLFVFEDSIKIMPGVNFELRSSLIEISPQKLLIISPANMSDEAYSALANKYEKVLCVSPNILHNKYLEKVSRLIPQAEIFGDKELKKKVPALKDSLNNPKDLEAKLEGKVSLHSVFINKAISEIEFYHLPTKTLILTDLIFNMKEPMPLGRRLILKMVGAYNKLGQSKLLKMSIKERDKYLSSLESLSNLEPKRLIVGHGSIIENPNWNEVIKVCKS